MENAALTGHSVRKLIHCVFQRKVADGTKASNQNLTEKFCSLVVLDQCCWRVDAFFSFFRVLFLLSWFLFVCVCMWLCGSGSRTPSSYCIHIHFNSFTNGNYQSHYISPLQTYFYLFFFYSSLLASFAMCSIHLIYEIKIIIRANGLEFFFVPFVKQLVQIKLLDMDPLEIFEVSNREP